MIQLKYRNVLVLHSFHYPGRRHDGTVFYERYARRVGMELSRLDLSNMIVMESPKKRCYSRLTEHYNARWIVDLHNDTYPYDPEIRHLLAMLYVSTRYKPNADRSRNSAIRKWIRQNYTKSNSSTYPVSIANKVLVDKPSNFIGVELYPHNKINKSVEFVKKFSKLLYDGSI